MSLKQKKAIPHLRTKNRVTTLIYLYFTIQTLSSKNTVDNVKYQEAQYVGLTMDQKVNESYVIQFGKEKLKVLYVNPFGRFNQVFMVTV